MTDHGYAAECDDERGRMGIGGGQDMGIKATACATHWGQVEALCEDQHWVTERFLEIMTATWPEGMSAGPASGDAPVPRRYPPGVGVGVLRRPAAIVRDRIPGGSGGPPAVGSSGGYRREATLPTLSPRHLGQHKTAGGW